LKPGGTGGIYFTAPFFTGFERSLFIFPAGFLSTLCFFITFSMYKNGWANYCATGNLSIFS
jgi:hypothetical protein